MFRISTRIAVVSLAALGLIGTLALERPTAQAPSGNGVTALTGVRIIDGTGGPAVERGTIVISNGRITAAGAISFDDGVKFVRARGTFMDEAAEEKPGLMAAVMGLGLAEVEKVCAATGAQVGNLNAPGQIVISGYRANVEAAVEKFREIGAKKVIPLDVSGGFHSSCMEPACRRIERELSDIAVRKPAIPVVSNLTGTPESDPGRIKQNLIWQMNHRTLWEGSMRLILSSGVKHFIEFSPGKVLKGLLRRIDPSAQTISLSGAEDFHALD